MRQNTEQIDRSKGESIYTPSLLTVSIFVLMIDFLIELKITNHLLPNYKLHKINLKFILCLALLSKEKNIEIRVTKLQLIGLEKKRVMKINSGPPIDLSANTHILLNSSKKYRECRWLDFAFRRYEK